MQRKHSLLRYQVYFFLFFLLIPVITQARHIIGGELTYECLGAGFGNSRDYLITMHVYRDCSSTGAGFDSPATFGIYRFANNQYEFVRTASIFPTPPEQVPPPNNPCLIVPPNVCVQSATYQFNVNLPLFNGSYFIHWQRCCRNNTISNIINPQETGATYNVEITAAGQDSCNTSPVFNLFPPTVICVNDALNFDHSATDAEGDQLVYEFCAPLNGGGIAGADGNPGMPTDCNGVTPNPANCLPPYINVSFVGPTYTPTRPLAGNPVVTIDPVTGRITGTPEILGQFVVGVCVKEYRDGVLLSVVRRDFQFNVSTCEPTVEAGIQADAVIGGQEFIINSCGSNTVNFVNESQLIAFINSYEWTFDINGTLETYDTRDVTITFPDVGNYSGKMIINKGTECVDSADIRVNVYPEINADFEYDYDTCIAGPVAFTDNSISGSGTITDWSWRFGDNQQSFSQDPSHRYVIPGNHEVELLVTDINDCKDSLSRVINYFPVPPLIIVEPNSYVGCAPASIFFNNLSIPIDSTYIITWHFGDETDENVISPTFEFLEPGTFDVSVEIESPIGCYTSTNFSNWITIRPGPIAAFTYSPEEITNFNSLVSFSDQSLDAVGWLWQFGPEGISFEQNPTHNFRDTGLAEVKLIAYHENGCADTAIAMLDIMPQVRYFLPNAFSPNNDAKNDVFKGVGVTDHMQDFNMKIFSRWGELVFESDDPSSGWNGQKFNSGSELPVGVYVCIVKYIDPRNNPVELNGFATLLR